MCVVRLIGAGLKYMAKFILAKKFLLNYAENVIMILSFN